MWPAAEESTQARGRRGGRRKHRNVKCMMAAARQEQVEGASVYAQWGQCEMADMTTGSTGTADRNSLGKERERERCHKKRAQPINQAL